MDKMESISEESLAEVPTNETSEQAEKDLIQEGAGESEVTEAEVEKAGEVKEEEVKETSTSKEEAAPENKPKKPISIKDFKRSVEEEDGEEIQKPVAKPVATKKELPASRDYTGIAEEDKPFFQKMGNESFERMKGIYQENQTIKNKQAELEKQLKEGTGNKRTDLPDNYLQHPKAFMLDPQYEVLQNTFGQAETIKKHWATQLARIRRGEKWEDLSQDKAGNLIKTEAKEATAEAETQVEENLEFAREQSLKVKKDYEGFVEGFKTKYQEAEDEVKLVKDKYFKGWDDPKHETAPLQKQVLDSIHPAYKNHPLAQMVAFLTAANAKLNNMIKEREKGVKIEEGKKKDAAAAQPTKKKFVAAPVSTNGVVKFSDFKREREVEV